MSGLVSMQLSKKASTKEAAPSAIEAPLFPYGLTISLGEDELTKLRLDKSLPEAGDEMDLVAKVRVRSVESHDTEGGGKRRSLSLQLTDMALAPAKKERDLSKVFSNTLKG